MSRQVQFAVVTDQPVADVVEEQHVLGRGGGRGQGAQERLRVRRVDERPHAARVEAAPLGERPADRRDRSRDGGHARQP